MRKLGLIVILLASATMLGARPGHASYYDGPWCGVWSSGWGGATEKCDYRTFEACRMDIIAGNRGFCRPNGYWQGGMAHAPKARKAKRRSRH